MQQIETEHVTFKIVDGILHCSYHKNLDMDLRTAQQIVSDRISFTGGKPYPILIDFTNLKGVSKDAREYMNNAGLKGIKCGAFLSNSVVTKTFINLYLKINKPVIPTRFFTNKNEALEWLSSIEQQ